MYVYTYVCMYMYGVMKAVCSSSRSQVAFSVTFTANTVTFAVYVVTSTYVWRMANLTAHTITFTVRQKILTVKIWINIDFRFASRSLLKNWRQRDGFRVYNLGFVALPPPKKRHTR